VCMAVARLFGEGVGEGMSERSELSEIIIAVTELRDKSSYKKTYENILKTLKRKLARHKFEGFRIVDNAPATEQVAVESKVESTLTKEVENASSDSSIPSNVLH
jgi:hypothetical protein